MRDPGAALRVLIHPLYKDACPWLFIWLLGLSAFCRERMVPVEAIDEPGALGQWRAMQCSGLAWSPSQKASFRYTLLGSLKSFCSPSCPIYDVESSHNPLENFIPLSPEPFRHQSGVQQRGWTRPGSNDTLW